MHFVGDLKTGDKIRGGDRLNYKLVKNSIERTLLHKVCHQFKSFLNPPLPSLSFVVIEIQNPWKSSLLDVFLTK